MTAARETNEEVGIEIPPDDLLLIWETRAGHSLFEYHLKSSSKHQIDNCEIIEAQFVDPAYVTDPDSVLDSYLKRVLNQRS